jgi:hypothetical protein
MFGIVYKGKAKGFDQTIVIKDLTIENSRSIEEWKREITLMRCEKDNTSIISYFYYFLFLLNLLSFTLLPFRSDCFFIEL